MKTVNGFFRWLSSLALHLSVFFVIFVFSFIFTIGSSQSAKNILEDSGVYDSFIQTIIDLNTENTQSENVSSIPLDDPEVQKIIKSTFNSDFLQKNTEVVVDGVYMWLDGSEEKIKFAIDLNNQKNSLVEALSTYAVARIEKLPACTTQPTQLDIFSVTCKPYGFEPNAVKNQIINDLNTSEIFEDTSITQENIINDDSDKEFYEKTAVASSAFRVLQKGIPLSIFLFIVAALVFIRLRKPFKKAVRALGRDLSANGLAIIGFTVFYGYILPRYTDFFSFKSSGGNTIQNQLIDEFTTRINIVIISVSAGVSLIGLLLILYSKYLAKGAKKYDGIKSKSGLASSTAADKTSYKKRLSPPVQSSEKKSSKKISKSKSKKYRKIGL